MEHVVVLHVGHARTLADVLLTVAGLAFTLAGLDLAVLSLTPRRRPLRRSRRRRVPTPPA